MMCVCVCSLTDIITDDELLKLLNEDVKEKHESEQLLNDIVQETRLSTVYCLQPQCKACVKGEWPPICPLQSEGPQTAEL